MRMGGAHCPLYFFYMIKLIQVALIWRKKCNARELTAAGVRSAIRANHIGATGISVSAQGSIGAPISLLKSRRRWTPPLGTTIRQDQSLRREKRNEPAVLQLRTQTREASHQRRPHLLRRILRDVLRDVRRTQPQEERPRPRRLPPRNTQERDSPEKAMSWQLGSNDQKERLAALLKRHIRTEDKGLSDRDLVLHVLERYKKYLDEPLIDVSE